MIVERTSVSLLFKSSAGDTGVGNLPATTRLAQKPTGRREVVHAPLERPGPRRRGICLMSASDAKKASYFFASFLTSFLFLFSLRASHIENSSGHAERFHALLQIVHRHVLQINLLRAVDVCRISENADRHARARHIGQPAQRSAH